MSKSIKSSRGYLKSKYTIIKFLEKNSVAKYNKCAVVPKSKLTPIFYCYNYEIANAISDYLQNKKNLKRIKIINGGIDYKYIFLDNK